MQDIMRERNRAAQRKHRQKMKTKVHRLEQCLTQVSTCPRRQAEITECEGTNDLEVTMCTSTIVALAPFRRPQIPFAEMPT
jgi:hypothetical protein